MGQKRVYYHVVVTPQIAEEIIQLCNLRNRKVRQNKVLQFVRYMGGGEWQFMGDLIVTAAGELIDGQHRILAVMESGVTVEMVVMVVPAREAKKINEMCDGGTPRNISDFLHFNGVPDAHRVAPILKYERNISISGSPLQTAAGEKADFLKAYETLTHEPFQRMMDAMPRGLYLQVGVSRGFLDWFLMRVMKFERSAGELFFALLGDPSELKKTDPPYVLREGLIDLQRRSRKISLVQQSHMIAKAWGFFHESQPATLGKIRHRANENWPGIAGDPEEKVKEQAK